MVVHSCIRSWNVQQVVALARAKKTSSFPLEPCMVVSLAQLIKNTVRKAAKTAVKRVTGEMSLALPIMPPEKGNGVLVEQMCGDRGFMEHRSSLAPADSLLPLINTLFDSSRQSQRIV